jgi:hypothetical protein
LHQFASQGRTLGIPIAAHLLSDTICLSLGQSEARAGSSTRDIYLHWIYHTVRLPDPQIPLEAQQHDRNPVLSPVVQVYSLAPIPLRILQTRPVVDIIAQDYKVWLKQCEVLRGGGVIEFEAIGAIVHADIVHKGLVYITQELDLG